MQPIIQDQYRNSLSGPHQNIARNSAPYWIVSRHVHDCTRHSYVTSTVFNYIIIHDKLLLLQSRRSNIRLPTDAFQLMRITHTDRVYNLQGCGTVKTGKGTSKNLYESNQQDATI